MKIVIDTFGCDNPIAVIKGLSSAINATKDVILVAVGDKDVIESTLKDQVFDRARLEIVDAKDVITNNDSPLEALRAKKDASMVRAYQIAKQDDEVIAFTSGGNTGAVIVGAVLLLGKAQGVEMPALSTVLPTIKGTYTCLVDCGASIDSRAVHLLRFAKLGSEYMKNTYGIESPRVALLSVGTEDKKGNALTKEAFALLKESDLNFVGNMEAKTLLAGDVDVIVTDGFAGNVALKSVEGVSSTVVRIMVDLLKKNAPEGTDLTFVKKAVGEFMSIYDFNSMGGAVLLGTKKPVIKMHGSANETTVINVVKQALQMCSNKGE
ncbi:MAG: phosphate acyltransferase PlsX [Clostridia bacterium]|nr:phosphate acyltransferase PlsX [Clostridia bacterium]